MRTGPTTFNKSSWQYAEMKRALCRLAEQRAIGRCDYHIATVEDAKSKFWERQIAKRSNKTTTEKE